MAGCEPTPEVKAILKAMARAKLQEGHTDPDVILSHIHEAIKDHTLMHKSEIADAISGVGEIKNARVNDAAAHMAALNAELRDLQKVQDQYSGKIPAKENPRDAAERKAVQNQIAELKRQIDYGHDVPADKTKAPDSEALAALKTERDALKQELENTRPSPPATHPLDPNEVKNKALRTSLTNRIAKLEAKIAAGDTSEPVKHNFMRDQANRKLQEQHDALVAKLETMKPAPEAKPATDPMVRKNLARQTAVKNQIAEYQRRMDAKDFTKRERKPVEYNKETQRWIAARNDAKYAYELALHRFEQENRSDAAKVADLIVELHRAAVLSSPGVLVKLPAVALTNIAARPLLIEPAGAVLKRVPGIKGIFDKAPHEGQAAGYAKAEGGALKETFSMDTARAMGSYVKTGTHQLMSEHGQRDVEFQSDLKLAQFIGNLHGALKVPAAINAWKRAMIHGTEHEAKMAKASGMTDAEVTAHLHDAGTQAKIGAEAWVEAEREIFQGPNVFNSVWQTVLARLSNFEGTKLVPANPATKAVAAGGARVMRFLLPITKVPTNRAIAASGYVGGAFGGLAQLAIAADKGWSNKLLLRNAVHNITPQQANSIARNFKRQAVGLPLLAIGAYLYKNFGGMYQQGDSKNKMKPDAESIKTPYFDIPKVVLEHPMLAALQMGATAAWVAHKPKGDMWEGMGAAAVSLVADNPFIEEPKSIARGMAHPAKLAGALVGSMNPQAFQWAAKRTDAMNHADDDESKTHAFFFGKDVRRDSRKTDSAGKQFVREIEKGVPGLRTDVPIKVGR